MTSWLWEGRTHRAPGPPSFWCEQRGQGAFVPAPEERPMEGPRSLMPDVPQFENSKIREDQGDGIFLFRYPDCKHFGVLDALLLCGHLGSRWLFMLYLLPIIHTPRSTESGLHSRSRTVRDKEETYNRAYTSSDNGIRDGEAALTTVKQGQQSRDEKQEVSGGGISSVSAQVHPRVDRRPSQLCGRE